MYLCFNSFSPLFLQIDQQAAVTLDEPIEQGFRTLDLSSPLVVGAAVDYKDGYVGCIRGLLVNGVMQDLRGMVERGQVTYGLSAGQSLIISQSLSKTGYVVIICVKKLKFQSNFCMKKSSTHGDWTGHLRTVSWLVYRIVCLCIKP